MKYTFEIRNSAGERVIDLTDCVIGSKSVTITRNREDLIQVRCDLDILRKKTLDNGMDFWDTIGVNINELRVYRDDKCISAGQITYVYADMKTDTKSLDITAFGWFYLLQFAYTDNDVTYSATDAGAIAWGLINTAQTRTNGDYGITQGTIQTSVNRDRSYDIRKNIYDAIVQLSEVINGFDFEITWDKVFNVYYPKQGSKRDDLIFTYPGNVKELSVTRDGTQMANKIYIRGAGTGEELFESSSEDLIMQGNYKLREKIIVEPDISDITTLTQHSDAELNAKKQIIDILEVQVDGGIEPVFGSYNVGDEVKFQTYYQEVFGIVNKWFRIDQIKLSVDENNQEDINLKLINI